MFKPINHGWTKLKDTKISNLVFETKYSQTDSKILLMVVYFLFAYEPVNFSLSLNPAIHRTSNIPYSLCPRLGERDEANPHFIFRWKLSKTTLAYIIELTNYSFNT